MQEHFEWVRKIIESCTNGFQLECAQKMVELFEQRYGKTEEHEELLCSIAKQGPIIMVV